MPSTYLDSSAIVKLVVVEPESVALRRHLRRRTSLVTSALARTEVLRALLEEGELALGRARSVLSALDIVRINDRVLTAAGLLRPAALRSLDAIHLATAQLLATDLAELVSYDDRVLQAAKSLGLRTAAPR